jgi:4-hydroxybenzoate polyprenyltransferase
VTLITVLLAVAGGLEVGRVVLIGFVMLLDQASVGLSNDWLDAGRDREAGRTDKPVARGDLPARWARNVAIVLAAASVALSIPLGWPVVIAHLVFLASAWAYNLVLKNTVVSVLPYITGFGALPAMVALAAVPPQFPPVTTVIAGALLGVAAHFTNVLPDLEDDAKTGIRGLPHRLGRVTGHVITWLSLLGAAVSLGIGIGGAIGVAGVAVAAVVAIAGLVLGLRRAPTRVLFRLVMLAAVTDVVLLVVGGAS